MFLFVGKKKKEKRTRLHLIFGGELIVTSCGNVTNVYFVVVLVAFFLIVLLNEQGEEGTK